MHLLLVAIDHLLLVELLASQRIQLIEHDVTITELFSQQMPGFGFDRAVILTRLDPQSFIDAVVQLTNGERSHSPKIA